MGHGRGKSASYKEPPTAAPSYPDYEITGLSNPPCTGLYQYYGQHNGQPWFQKSGGGFGIWWDSGTSEWIISLGPDIKTPGYWARLGLITGPYGPHGSYAGYPLVSEVP